MDDTAPSSAMPRWQIHYCLVQVQEFSMMADDQDTRHKTGYTTIEHAKNRAHQVEPASPQAKAAAASTTGRGGVVDFAAGSFSSGLTVLSHTRSCPSCCYIRRQLIDLGHPEKESVLMAPATPAQVLPKSKYHQSVVSAATERSVPPAAPPLRGPLPHADTSRGLDEAGKTFIHPNHVIPPKNYAGVDNLVIVCCHAIFHPDVDSSSFPLHSPYDERNWHLAPFQRSNPATRKPGEHETFLSHISAGCSALTTGSWATNSVLVFSGGATKQSLTSLTEARSYYNAALALDLSRGYQSGFPTKTLYDAGRILLEESATDSYQNLLFSILLFRQTVGSYPKDIRIITHAFKAKRFLELHAPAICWPSDYIRVQGIDPVMSSEELVDTVQGESRYGQDPWREDPLGTGEILSQKRKARGWEDKTDAELGKGLEDSIRQLLNGKVHKNLPWRDAVTPSVE
ncbi:hypothetical protein BU24DRAFT_457034 [Aaosphaeria arxii CBS 175.79]|uniref:DUF218 domain-containing protein n=1 Tax=Aaosphaeria arxii CBS 175.79 TaxID=1450172 RepID=A0A6A5Y673_9PLEO|nr:uncharacterized protein BU24DRAFT_457034 [Aaosphaeria arxii CBS 175.79]KAF2021018.1 hypothetical protein BU24DRAFT_457034 [Aaosphaeria arxii CBS 175.79]